MSTINAQTLEERFPQTPTSRLSRLSAYHYEAGHKLRKEIERLGTREDEEAAYRALDIVQAELGRIVNEIKKRATR